MGALLYCFGLVAKCRLGDTWKELARTSMSIAKGYCITDGIAFGASPFGLSGLSVPRLQGEGFGGDSDARLRESNSKSLTLKDRLVGGARIFSLKAGRPSSVYAFGAKQAQRLRRRNLMNDCHIVLDRQNMQLVAERPLLVHFVFGLLFNCHV